MIQAMRHTFNRLLRLGVTAAVALMPLVALAAPESEETQLLEARYEGYATPVKLANAGSPLMAWVMVIFLTVVAIACLFKNARRTHLD